ncbi:DnaD domain-containing protein [Macrococcus equi]|uniref:DnaD domain-containing protein n=1 Tax=Macrococcus equi TaxID=3395462 RepID=UPI0039BE3510
MANFRMVQTSIWEDEKFQEDFSPEDRLMWLCLLTNPKTTQTGIYKITMKQLEYFSGFSKESSRIILGRFIEKHKLVKYNEETRELCILNWGKHNLNRGGKPMEDCIKKELSEVQDKSFITEVKKHIRNAAIKAIYDTFDDTSDVTLNDTKHDTLTISGQEKEEEEDKEKEEEKEEDVRRLATSTSKNESTENPFNFFQENSFGPLTPYISQEMTHYINDFEKGHGESALIASMKIGLDRNRPKWGYIKSILREWLDNNIKNMEQIRAYEKRKLQDMKTIQRPYNNQSKEMTPKWINDESQDASNSAGNEVTLEMYLDAKKVLFELSEKEWNQEAIEKYTNEYNEVHRKGA